MNIISRAPREGSAGAILFLLAASLAWADFTPSTWKYRKRLHVEAGKPISAAHIDRQVFAHAQVDLDDIRIVRGSEEVPYVVTRLSGSHESREIEAEVLDRAAIGDAVRFELSLGRVKRHSRITLATNETNFRKQLRIESSPDRKSWALVKKEAYIFDFTYEAQHSQILGIDYPVSTQPFMRVTIQGWQDPALITGATVSLAEDRPPVRQIIQEFAKLTPEEDGKSKSTVYVLDFGEPGVPKDQLRFELSGDALFHRAIEIETSGDNKSFVPHGRGVIYRVSGEQSLWVHLPDTRSRYLRVRIFHGDDKALQVKSIVAESILRKVIYPVNNSGDFWLYYGNAAAKRPSYDLPMVLAKSSMESAATINPAPEETNPGYLPPPPPVKPFSDRYPELLYAVLGIAVLSLGYLTVQFIRKASPKA